MAGPVKLTGENAKLAMMLLQSIADVFHARGIPYWLEAGTLLGAVREHRLLPWDSDVDLAVRSDCMPEIYGGVLPAIVQLGLAVEVHPHTRDIHPFSCREPRIVNVRMEGVLYPAVDIFITKKVDNEYFFGVASYERYTLHSVPAHFYDNLVSKHLMGGSYSMPAETEDYLAYRYGADWRTPKRKWDCTSDDGAIVK